MTARDKNSKTQWGHRTPAWHKPFVVASWASSVIVTRLLIFLCQFVWSWSVVNCQRSPTPYFLSRFVFTFFQVHLYCQRRWISSPCCELSAYINFVFCPIDLFFFSTVCRDVICPRVVNCQREIKYFLLIFCQLNFSVYTSQFFCFNFSTVCGDAISPRVVNCQRGINIFFWIFVDRIFRFPRHCPRSRPIGHNACI